MRIFVKVKARAKKNRLEKVDADHYRVWVKAVPEKGKANGVVAEILSEHFGVARSTISIVSGQTSSQKVIQVVSLQERLRSLN